MKIAKFGLSLLLGTALALAGCGGASNTTGPGATPGAPPPASQAAAPTIMSPSDRSTNVPFLAPTFFWLTVSKATYDFQLAADSSFSSIIDQQNNLRDNTYILAVELTPETMYYWRVRADVKGKAASYWVTAKFTTGANVTAAHPPAPAGE
jgi:hypothetical protein